MQYLISKILPPAQVMKLNKLNDRIHRFLSKFVLSTL